MDKTSFLALLDKYLNHEASEEEAEALHNYYESFSEDDDVEKYLKTDLKRAEDLGLARLRATIKGREVSTRPKRIRSFSYMAAAGIALIAVLVTAVILYRDKKSPGGEQSVVSAKGEQRIITLKDGTKVQLNAASELIFPEKFEGKTREIVLKGEAFFEVARDPSKPFIVHTDKIDVRVLGTAFNVKAYPGDETAEAALISGKVEVSLKGTGIIKNKIVLKPAQKLEYLVNKNEGTGGITVTDKKNDAMNVRQVPEVRVLPLSKGIRNDLPAETEWTASRLTFRGEKLKNVMATLERRFNAEITIENENYENLQVSTSVDKGDNIENQLYAISQVYDIRYRKEGKNKFVIY